MRANSPAEIFILEDDLVVREFICIVLEKAGYTPVCFADGDSLLAGARRRYPACILLDIMLPGKSGLDVLFELRKALYLAPVIMVSGHGNIQTAMRAGKMGAVDFIEKPFKPSELIERIRRATSDASRLAGDPVVAASSQVLTGLKPFTRREQQIVDQMLLGKSCKDIALLLELSPRTVEDHRSNILSKAKVKTTAQFVTAVLQSGIRRAGVPGHI